MNYVIYVLSGLLPSLIWLIFYLRKDKHPESNKTVLKIFFYGMLIALPAVLLEMSIIGGVEEINERLNIAPIVITIFNMFIGVAFVEEFLKFLVVQEKVLKNSELDEPVDLPIYMIVSALGFAASENILLLFSFQSEQYLGKVFSISLLRFLGATFLHGLVSGMLGYFLAIAICNPRNRLKIFSLGLFLAVLLHGLYNFSIMKIGGTTGLIIPVLILIFLTVFLTAGFKKLKSLKSVCNIN